MTETVRRQAALYDQQFGALKTILALIYRARNAAREIYQSDGRADRDAYQRLQAYHTSMQEILFEQRAILPKDVFLTAHDSKHHLIGLLSAIERFRRPGRSEPRPDHNDEVRKIYELLDAGYQRLVSAVQSHIKIECANNQFVRGK